MKMTIKQRKEWLDNVSDLLNETSMDLNIADVIDALENVESIENIYITERIKLERNSDDLLDLIIQETREGILTAFCEAKFYEIEDGDNIIYWKDAAIRTWIKSEIKEYKEDLNLKSSLVRLTILLNSANI